MTDTERRIADLKAQLDALRADGHSQLPVDLQRANDIELTYASNAIEGNTLTHSETAELIEHGISAGGKALKDHHEILDHHEALQWMREQVAERRPVDEAVVLELHRRALKTSRPDIAGTYARFNRRIAGSPVVLPNPLKVPVLMERFGADLAQAEGPRSAFDAHYRLVTIHPFDDGNGRTARLLTNMMLLRDGYVPVSVRPEERREYLDTLRDAQLAQDDSAPAFHAFMLRRLEAALTQHVGDLSSGVDAGDRERSGPTAAQLAAFAAQRGSGR